jgi:predicted RNA-binding protein with PUA-like domain
MAKKYWLMKCELSECSFDELKNDRPNSTGKWRGVRNYQARNFLRDEMKKGDLVVFYQSNCDEPGSHGLAIIARAGYPDPSQFDPKHKYYDEDSTEDEPRWYSADVKWKKPFKNFVSLKDLKANPKLKDMKVVQRFQRLSVQPVTKQEFEIVCKMGGIKPL